jgi:hypothetical protein
MEVSGQLHEPAVLPPRKRPRYPLDRRLGGLQIRSGHGGEEKNSKPPPGIKILCAFLIFSMRVTCPAHLTILTFIILIISRE